jgi:hypothetical protein
VLLKRRLKASVNRKRRPPATVLLGWTPMGRPVASLPLRSPVAVQLRIRTWRRKGYVVSSLVEWDFI